MESAAHPAEEPVVTCNLNPLTFIGKEPNLFATVTLSFPSAEYDHFAADTCLQFYMDMVSLTLRQSRAC